MYYYEKLHSRCYRKMLFYYELRYKNRDIDHRHIKIICIIYASLCEISSNLSCFLIFIKTYIVRIFRFWSNLSHVVRGNRKSFTGYDELFLPWRRKIAGNFPLARRIAPCICVCMCVCVYARRVVYSCVDVAGVGGVRRARSRNECGKA